MFDYKKLAAQVAAKQAEMEATLTQIQDLTAKTDVPDAEKVTKLAALDANFKALEVDMGTLSTQMARAQLAQEAKEMAAKAQLASGLVAPTIIETAPNAPTTVPARAKTFGEEERIHRSAFQKWLGQIYNGKTAQPLTDAEHEALQPQSKKLAALGDGAVMPISMAKNLVGDIFGGGGIMGKAMQSDDVSNLGHDEIFDDEFRPRLLELMKEPASLFPRTTRVPSTTGTVKWPRLKQTDGDEYAGVSVQWTDEGSEKPETEAEFEQLVINTHELSAQTQVSRTLLGRSAIDLSAFISSMFRERIMDELDSVLLKGSGSGRPLGVVRDSDVRSVLRTDANKVTYEDTVAMKYALRANHRSRAIFVLADDAAEQMTKELDGDGRPFFVPNPLAGQFDRLLGIPTITTHRTNLGFDGDLIIGDWSQFISVVESEILIQRSEHRHMEKGLILFVVTMLVGGRAALPRAFAVLQKELS